MPISYINAIDKLAGNNGLYPSRSELIRVAMRDFLIRELEAAISFVKLQPPSIPNLLVDIPPSPPPAPVVDAPDPLFVKVPISETQQNGEMQYKTYRIVKK